MIGEGIEEEEAGDNLLGRKREREDSDDDERLVYRWRGWAERAIDLSSIVLPDHVLRALNRALAPILSLSLIPARLSSPSSRHPEIHRADNAKGPAARWGNAFRPSLARAWTRHRHAPGRMDFRYVTGNPCRVYDYSLRDGDATVTHTHTRARARAAQRWRAWNTSERVITEARRFQKFSKMHRRDKDTVVAGSSIVIPEFSGRFNL